jgi:hypothetical protein
MYAVGLCKILNTMKYFFAHISRRAFLFVVAQIFLFVITTSAFAQSCEEKKAHLVSSLVEYAQTKSSIKRDELLNEISTLQNSTSYNDGSCPFDNQLNLIKNDLNLPVSESDLTKDPKSNVSEAVVPISINNGSATAGSSGTDQPY